MEEKIEVKTTTTTRKEVLYEGRTFLAKGKEGNEKNRVMCFFLPVMEEEKDGKKKKTRGMFLSWKAFLGCPLLLLPSLSLEEKEVKSCLQTHPTSRRTYTEYIDVSRSVH